MRIKVHCIRLFLGLASLFFFSASGAQREAIQEDLEQDPIEVPDPSHARLEDPQEEGLKAERAYVVPVEGTIGKASVYIIRRALKTAMREQVPFVILSIDTPGGDLESTLDIMEMLQRFDGEVLAFIKKEAISAGAFIAAACHAIYMAPYSVVGAAAPVQGGGGQDIPKTLNMKLMSFMRAKVRGLKDRGRYREEALRAMMDESFVFTVEGKTLKGEGELLSLTSEEAQAAFGEPPEPLFSQGTAASPQLAMTQHLEGEFIEVEPFETAWAEDWAQMINALAPVLMGIAMILVFIELQTPTFGLLGLLGLCLFGFVFMGQYLAGFAGYEALVILILGVTLIGVEIFVVPGTLIAGILGGVLLLGSLVWMLADIWPQSPSAPPTPFDWSVLEGPLIDVALSLLIAFIGALLLIRFLPRRWVWDRLILKAQVQGTSSPSQATPRPNRPTLPPVGAVARTCTDLMPSGEITYQDKRYEALSCTGFIPSNTPVRIVEHRDFSLLVEPTKDSNPKST